MFMMKNTIVGLAFLGFGNFALAKHEPVMSEPKESGVVGATCWSELTVYRVVDGVHEKANCFNTPELFFPGVTMVSAKKTTIRECEILNALDYSGVKPGRYEHCKTDIFCIYGDNR